MKSVDARAQSVERIPALDLTTAWTACSDLYCGLAVAGPVAPTREQFERELLFCLLGGFGVSFELAHSASSKLSTLNPFSSKWAEAEILDRVRWELCQAQFE